MKRPLSILVLWAYCAQLGMAYRPLSAEQEFNLSGAVAYTKLTGEQELPFPRDVEVPTERASDGLVPGAIEGHFAVTPDGAATYQVPLWVPPGRAGLQPNLSLSYHSSAGNGLLGVGWSLGGLSRITRCNKTLAQDGAPQAVQFNDSDAFCMDGKRLVQVGGATGSSRTFTTEVEEFSLITSQQEDARGPQGFKVQLKSGLTLEYGLEGNSRVEGYRTRYLPASSNPHDPRVVGDHTSEVVRYAWALSKVTDRQGNFMTVDYQLRVHGDATQGYAYEHLPLLIRYTGSTTDPSLSRPRRAVRFLYRQGVTRGDALERYVSGFKLLTTQLLEQVQLWGPGPGSESFEVLLRAYVLYYRHDSISRRSLLYALYECDGRYTCKRPTLFTWELGHEESWRIAPPAGGDRYFERVALPYAAPSPVESGGFPDSEGFLSAPDFWSLQTLDLNGDGRDDLMYRYSPRANNRLLSPEWYYRLNLDGRSFGPPVVLHDLPKARTGDGLDDLRTVDLNNDGKVDVVGLHLADATTGSNGRYQFFLSNGAGFAPAQEETFDFWFDGRQPARVPALHVADVTGDGLPDILR